jgi:hypothetical protein
MPCPARYQNPRYHEEARARGGSVTNALVEIRGYEMLKHSSADFVARRDRDAKAA